MAEALPGIDDVRAAAARIRGHVHRTPIATCASIDRKLDARIFFKCENLQKVGAFKARGATNAVLSLDEESAHAGVITHSSGNHGAALAYAARARDIPCVVVIPEGAPRVKVDAVRGYGAEVVFCARGERQATVDRLLVEQPRTFVHPFEDPDVIAGQGTVALELLEQVEDLDVVIAPVGGGGLLSGTSISVRALRPQVRVLAAEPEAVDDTFRTFAGGELQPTVVDARSICDGLLTGLGKRPFAVLRGSGVSVVTATETQIAHAGLTLMQRAKLVVEPSAAVVLAALENCAPRIRGLRVGAILSGGNTDFGWVELARR